jgi:hypothetical protein
VLPPVTLAAAGEAAWRAVQRSVTGETLSFLAESGDVQLAVSLVLVLGRDAEAVAGAARMQRWTAAYVDMLQRLRLWAPAAAVMLASGSADEERKAATMVTPACRACGADALRADGAVSAGSGGATATTSEAEAEPRCASCSRGAACAVCGQTVRGLCSVCLVCGDGGHLACMADWRRAGHRGCPVRGCGCGCGST